MRRGHGLLRSAVHQEVDALIAGRQRVFSAASCQQRSHYQEQHQRQLPQFRSIHHQIQTRPLSGGIVNSIQGKIMQAAENRQLKTFRKQMKDMLEMDTFDLKDFRSQLEEGVSHWTVKLPGVSGSDEVQAIKRSIRIVDAIKPELQINPEAIKAKDRIEIARDSGESVAEVEKLLNSFERSHMIFWWIKARRAAGQRIPRNPAELEELAVDTRGISMRKFVKINKKKDTALGALRRMT